MCFSGCSPLLNFRLGGVRWTVDCSGRCHLRSWPVALGELAGAAQPRVSRCEGWRRLGRLSHYSRHSRCSSCFCARWRFVAHGPILTCASATALACYSCGSGHRALTIPISVTTVNPR